MVQGLTASIAWSTRRLHNSQNSLLGVLDHDLRNPSGAVQGSAQSESGRSKDNGQRAGVYSEDDIDSAVSAGVITAEVAAAFRAHVASTRHSPAVDEEHFRLVSGFNDVFVVVASALLLAAVGWIGASITPVLGMLLVAGAAWLLAEFFVRRRRMALPAIVLLLAFVGSMFSAGYVMVGALVTMGRPLDPPTVFAGASLVAALATWVHWWRFRVPITVAAGAAAAVGGVVATLLVLVPEARQWGSQLIFAAGLAVFAVALRWDARDLERKTRRADVAFWLHLLAAPLLVHPVFTSLGVVRGEVEVELVRAAAVLALYLAIALVSLWIDRRALMVSALGYVLYAFTQLLKDTGVVQLSFAVTAFVVGAALLSLSAFWHRSRAAVLPLLPHALRHLVPQLQ